jgi:hypothetical protein
MLVQGTPARTNRRNTLLFKINKRLEEVPTQTKPDKGNLRLADLKLSRQLARLARRLANIAHHLSSNLHTALRILMPVRVPHILMRNTPHKVGKHVVQLVTIKMPALVTRRTRAAKSRQYKRVNTMIFLAAIK